VNPDTPDTPEIPDTLLRATGLTVGYRQPVLSNIDLEFGRGQFIALLGPNGAGKTTLLRTLSRHIEALAGKIEILGRDLRAIRPSELARAVAVCLTDNARPPLLSVGEFVALGRYPHTGFMGRLSASDVDIVRQALAAVAAGDLAERPVERLSDGERQKAVLARALAQEPKLMLLDEPTAHLDLKHRVEVMDILRSLCRAKGVTVLAALHDIDIAAKAADRVLLVGEGKVLGDGLPEAVLTGETVARLYDFGAASFDGRLGGIEFRGDGRAGKVFVIAGRGAGAPLFRLLSKKGLAIETGVLDDGDLDTFVANALGARTFVRQTRGGGPDPALAAALAALPGCDFAVDCGVAGNDAAALRERCAERGLPLFCLGVEKQRPPTDEEAARGVCADLAELSAAIDRSRGRRRAVA
jgi:iron complex transport system ATP-binding protein